VRTIPDPAVLTPLPENMRLIRALHPMVLEAAVTARLQRQRQDQQDCH
jgi:hypothetical protein